MQIAKSRIRTRLCDLHFESRALRCKTFINQRIALLFHHCISDYIPAAGIGIT